MNEISPIVSGFWIFGPSLQQCFGSLRMRCLEEENLPLAAGFELASPVHCSLAYGLRYELSAVPAVMSVVCCYIFPPRWTLSPLES